MQPLGIPARAPHGWFAWRLRKKLLGLPYRSGRSAHWVKVKNPKAPAVRERRATAELNVEGEVSSLARGFIFPVLSRSAKAPQRRRSFSLCLPLPAAVVTSQTFSESEGISPISGGSMPERARLSR